MPLPRMMELVDIRDLKSLAVRRAGSTPALGTITLLLLLACSEPKPPQITFTNETFKGWYSKDGINWRYCETTRCITADASLKQI